MFFVEARYHRDPSRVGAQVRYIAHREEGLTDGRRRELYGIGDRYRASRGDEPAIRKALREDARGLRNPVYFRFILTVGNAAAERFRRLDGTFCDRVLRDAVEKTFRGAARGAQGVFAIHQHGGQGRPAHPHVHALLSPRFENGMAVHLSPVRIQRITSVASCSARMKSCTMAPPPRPRWSAPPSADRASVPRANCSRAAPRPRRALRATLANTGPSRQRSRTVRPDSRRLRPQ